MVTVDLKTFLCVCVFLVIIKSWLKSETIAVLLRGRSGRAPFLTDNSN